jgi:hypothetical protein
VTSITDNGTGDYTVNFTTALPDANYASVATSSVAAGSGLRGLYRANGTGTTSACRFVNATNAAVEDVSEASVSIFR